MPWTALAADGMPWTSLRSWARALRRPDVAVPTLSEDAGVAHVMQVGAVASDGSVYGVTYEGLEGGDIVRFPAAGDMQRLTSGGP